MALPALPFAFVVELPGYVIVFLSFSVSIIVFPFAVVTKRAVFLVLFSIPILFSVFRFAFVQKESHPTVSFLYLAGHCLRKRDVAQEKKNIILWEYFCVTNPCLLRLV